MGENVIIAIIGVAGSVLGSILVNRWKTRALEERVQKLYERIFALEEENTRKDTRISHLEKLLDARNQMIKRLQDRIRKLERSMDTGPLGRKE